MARASAKTLLEAVERDRYGRREDRLTEVLACALATMPDLARWFITDGCDLPPPKAQSSLRIRTQGLLASSGRPDLEISYRTEPDRDICILSEQKVDANFTEYQRAGYPGWPRDRLVLVAPDLEKYREAIQFRHITWLRIAAEMHRIGERYGQLTWREKALVLDEPSVLRFLHEALAFIERQDVGVSSMEPIDHAIVDAYQRMGEARSRLYAFFQMIRADERIQAFAPAPVSSANHDTYLWFGLQLPNWPFLTTLGPESEFEICLQPSADFLDEEGEQPVLYAGFSFYPTNGVAPDMLVSRDSLVARALADLGAKVGMRDNRKQGKCVVAFPLADIAKAGGTLLDQARHAAGSAAEILLQMSRITSA